jgi:hypothetical protein
MPSIKLQQVKNFEKLLQYLETELGWPVEGREIDDIAFPFDLEADLGLDKKEVAKVRHVYRLKKMHKKQPFGIFFVDFEGKKMPVSVLKRILRTLALRRRANAKAADQLAWDVEDLIFISAVGEEKDASREISFAHFRKEPDNRHVLKVLAWDGGDTPLKMDHLDEVLHENLRFPDDVSDVEAWRKSWTAAFRTGIRQNIRRSEELAQALAALAMRINKEALSLIKKESANGPLKTLHAGFKDALIHDLTEEAFTDCYAQTITYGLLTAAITKVNQAGVKDLTSTSVLEMVPSTNPFLKDILSSFLEAGGRGQKGIDFDDLGVQDVIDLLRAESTDLPNILRDFGNLTQDEDPVIHFYETFLKIYNKDERVKRGAFYTPRPVVSYIVRSVDELLRKEFGLEDGLADTTTWGEMIKRYPAIKLPPLTDSPGEKKTIKETEPFVQILDPATGTATFLVEVINIIEKTVKAKAWAKLKKGGYVHDQHSKREEVLKAWNEYVPEHLLKRLHAYELMMAPYVIAHMKVGLKLAETGYRFSTEERARIYLTNALEPAKEFKDRLNFDIPALAIEAKQVNEVKKSKRYTVVLGNPPYSGVSANTGEWITNLVDDYCFVDGQPLGEQNTRWLLDDYVKFYRLSQFVLGVSGVGVFSLITNHSFIDNPTFRGFRKSLSNQFGTIDILDLHGNIKKKEKSPDGSEDKNVFDEIQQGVAVMTAFKVSQKTNLDCTIKHADLFGSRHTKYDFLGTVTSGSINWEDVNSSMPHYLFIHISQDLRAEYEEGMPITEVMAKNGWGVATRKDYLLVDSSKTALKARINGLLGGTKEGAAQAGIKDGPHWKFSTVQGKVGSEVGDRIKKYAYRPFDLRWVFYEPLMIERGDHRWPIAKHLIGNKSNYSLLVSRTGAAAGSPVWDVVFIADGLSDLNLFRRGGAFMFPLYLKNEGDELDLGPQNGLNFTEKFLANLCDKLGLKSGVRGLPEGISPEDILYYIYALLHSPTYRRRYSDFLKIDFPRIPMTADKVLFHQLSRVGSELAGFHLMRNAITDDYPARVVGNNRLIVGKVSWSKDTIWLNKELSVGIRGVSKDVWEYTIGGYQVCDKWLKGRKDQELTKADVDALIYMMAALSETLRLSREVDEIIEERRGWPKAFQ